MAASETTTTIHPTAEILGWELASKDGQTVTAKTIFKYMNGAGEIYLAYDFRKLKVWTYARDGQTTITVEAFDMGSPEEAFGVLTHDVYGKDVEIGRRSAYGMGFLQFWKGRWYFRILADEETPESRQAVQALGKALAAQIREAGTEPELLKRLPANGLRADTIHYFHTQICLNALYFFAVENLLQLSRETNAVLADYRFDEESAKLLIVA